MCVPVWKFWLYSAIEIMLANGMLNDIGICIQWHLIQGDPNLLGYRHFNVKMYFIQHNCLSNSNWLKSECIYL